VTVYIGESSLDDFSAQVLTHNTFTYYSTVEQIVNWRRKIKKKFHRRVFNKPLLGNDKGIQLQTKRLMGRIYEVRGCDGLGFDENA
jgi:hypothetical protein